MIGKASLNKNFCLFFRWAQPFSGVRMVESCWRLLLGRGWELTRGTYRIPHSVEIPGIWISETAETSTSRSGKGYLGFWDRDAGSGLERSHVWSVQPSELHGHPGCQRAGAGGGVGFLSPKGLKLSVRFTVQEGDASQSLYERTLIQEDEPSLYNHCFSPDAIKAEEYAVALEAYELLKELSIIWQVSECFGTLYFPMADPEGMKDRQFQFGSRRPNCLINFFEERRLPFEAEMKIDGRAVFDRNGKPSPWITVVPPGVHFLPTDPDADKKLQAILALGRELGFPV